MAYTSRRGCLRDCVNLLCGAEVLTEGGGTVENLRHHLALRGVPLRFVGVRVPTGKRGYAGNVVWAPPTLPRLMHERRGLFVVILAMSGGQEDHAVGVDCDRRMVFCNTMGSRGHGALPATAIR